jgi:hypothetical protein
MRLYDFLNESAGRIKDFDTAISLVEDKCKPFLKY